MKKKGKMTVDVTDNIYWNSIWHRGGPWDSDNFLIDASIFLFTKILSGKKKRVRFIDTICVVEFIFQMIDSISIKLGHEMSYFYGSLPVL